MAGSGKTLILLYRLRILHRSFPEKRFLVLTHNKPLSHDLQSRYHRIEGGLPENIEWATFLGWCRLHWPRDLKWIKPLSQYKRDRLVRQAWEKHLKDSAVTFPMFLSELDWFKDQSPMDRAGIPYGRPPRARLWADSRAARAGLRCHAGLSEKPWRETSGTGGISPGWSGRAMEDGGPGRGQVLPRI